MSCHGQFSGPTSTVHFNFVHMGLKAQASIHKAPLLCQGPLCIRLKMAGVQHDHWRSAAMPISIWKIDVHCMLHLKDKFQEL